MGADKIIEVENLKKYFPVKSSSFFRSPEVMLRAVDGVDFSIARGETLGLAGESGCGKTTTAKLLLNLYKPTGGKILCDGMDITKLDKPSLKKYRRKAQMVFQDPFESLNPRYKVKDTLEEPLIVHNIGNKEEKAELIRNIMTEVGLDPPKDFINRFPHELSGGQRQRVAIARAIILNPSFLISDEPVSMLDVSIRAGILNILNRLVDERNMAGLCISHDLSLIRYLCPRTAIMYLGRIVEIGPTEEVIKKRYHPYTDALLEAVPLPEPDIKYSTGKIKGEIPNAINIPEGCRFSNRCIRKTKLCDNLHPRAHEVEEDHWVECHLYNR